MQSSLSFPMCPFLFVFQTIESWLRSVQPLEREKPNRQPVKRKFRLKCNSYETPLDGLAKSNVLWRACTIEIRYVQHKRSAEALSPATQKDYATVLFGLHIYIYMDIYVRMRTFMYTEDIQLRSRKKLY